MKAQNLKKLFTNINKNGKCLDRKTLKKDPNIYKQVYFNSYHGRKEKNK